MTTPTIAPAPPDASGEDAYRALCEFLPWGYVVIDSEAKILEINAAAARVLGTPRARLMGTSLARFFPEAVLAQALADAHHMSRPGGVELELEMRTAPARTFQLHVQSFGTGTCLHYRVALLDVTDARRAHVALSRAADEMHDLYQNAPCGYHSLDRDGTIIRMNDTELRWLGYAREEVVRRMKLIDLMSAQSAAEFDVAFALLKKRGHVRDLQLELRRKNGSVLPVLLSATAVVDREHRFIETRANVFDITRRKRAEDEASRYAERLKGMASRAAEVQETERRALARELHDRVGQNLTALSINLNIVKGALRASTSPDVVTRLDESLALVDRTVESIRDVMTELRPAVLDDYGLAAMLRWYAEDFTRRTGLDVSVSGHDPTPRLAPAVERTLFRIVQESLTNVVKHAGARRVTLALEPGAKRFRLSIADDGSGFDAAALDQAHGWGLMIMRERAESVGGEVRVHSGNGQGTHVVVDVKA